MGGQDDEVTASGGSAQNTEHTQSGGPSRTKSISKARSRKKEVNTGGQADDGAKRRCVSTACIACRRRKSKCDGNLPACAACSSVYNTECVYDPNSDHRRKGVYKKDIDKLKTRNSTLEVLIQALLNVPEDEVPELVGKIRTCESLDTVAEQILAREAGLEDEEDDILEDGDPSASTFEGHISGKMGELRLKDGSMRYIGGTSNLLFLDEETGGGPLSAESPDLRPEDNGNLSWTEVTDDQEFIDHLLKLYFVWHYSYFVCLSKSLFYRDYKLGNPAGVDGRRYCTPLLVNAMLALGCHFTAKRQARADVDDASTAGDHFFAEAKRLIMENDEHEKPKLATVQALALMSVREAGCGREAKGWVYSGMSFRMALDLGLNLESGTLSGSNDPSLDDDEIDARRITFWGCFLFDKCWSVYMGRMPQLLGSSLTVPKFEIWPTEESEIWAAYSDSGENQSHAQPARTRAVALQISALCEISSDLMVSFYNPIDMEKAKGKNAELKKLSDIHQRLEAWRRNLPAELEPREGGLPSILVMHMFFQLLYIHLFRPFLKYNQATSPLPPNVSPRRLCTQAAAAISKLLRLYKRSHGLRQICNVVVYICHSAASIHLLNLPDKNAKRDITHGVKHLEEIAESWLCARRTLSVLNVMSRKWKVELPEEAAAVLERTEAKFGSWKGEAPVKSPGSSKADSPSPHHSPLTFANQQLIARLAHQQQQQAQFQQQQGYSPTTASQNSPGLLDNIPRRISHIQPLSHNPVVATTPPSAHAGPNRDSLGSLSTAHYATTPGTGVASGSPTNLPMSIPSTGMAAAGSPSALFGGVEQLLRTSEDWLMRDQSQLAQGFEQWPSINGEYDGGHGGWTNGGSVITSPTTPVQQVHGNHVNGNGSWSGYLNGNSGAASGFEGMSYNEAAWYQ